MRKLALKLEELSVETFETAELEQPRGTIEGRQEEYSPGWYCTAPLSCEYGCNTHDDGTCPSGYTCRETCRTCTEPGCGAPTILDSCYPTCPPC